MRCINDITKAVQDVFRQIRQTAINVLERRSSMEYTIMWTSMANIKWRQDWEKYFKHFRKLNSIWALFKNRYMYWCWHTGKKNGSNFFLYETSRGYFFFTSNCQKLNYGLWSTMVSRKGDAVSRNGRSGFPNGSYRRWLCFSSKTKHLCILRWRHFTK